jgi:hypothetical protein
MFGHVRKPGGPCSQVAEAHKFLRKRKIHNLGENTRTSEVPSRSKTVENSPFLQKHTEIIQYFGIRKKSFSSDVKKKHPKITTILGICLAVQNFCTVRRKIPSPVL